MRVLGILGGTFDPVHCAHLRLALEMRERLDLARVHLIPAAVPPHREAPGTRAEQRLALVRAAVEGIEGLEADDRELRRGDVSYTVDTLADLRAEHPDAALCLILGMDAFAELHTWHRWEALPELAHLAVAVRPGAPRPAEGPVAALLAERATDDPAALAAAPCGRVVLREIPRLEISATDIRARLVAGRGVECLVPAPVAALIQRDKLYRDAK